MEYDNHLVDLQLIGIGSRIFLGGGDGRVYGLDRKSGKKVWEFEGRGAFVGSAAVADGKLIIASDEGYVYCFGSAK